MTLDPTLTLARGVPAAPPRPALDLERRAAQLLDSLGEGRVQSAAYPTAWAAMLRRGGAPVFPDALRWLLDAQRPDGSWGAGVYQPHDRVVCTLAAAVALSSPGGPRADRAARAVATGCAYLRRRGDDWRGGARATIAFEMIVPRLLAMAREAGLALPYDDFRELESVREEKLRRIPADSAFRRPTTLLYSLEALDGLAAHAADVAKLVAPDGSLGCSIPSAAAFWMAAGEPAVLDYLRRAANPDGGFPEMRPIENFERLWVLDSLCRAGLARTRRARLVRSLRDLVDDKGPLGISEWFEPDLDDAAMALSLVAAGDVDYAARLRALLVFEGDEAFATYPHEIGLSTTANARALEAFSHAPRAFGPQIGKIVDYLMSCREGGLWAADKWHASSLYATFTIVRALAPLPGAELAGTAGRLVETQHPDGAWGAGDGTAEETAYAVLALDTLAAAGHRVDPEILGRAATYLHGHLDDAWYPELWIGKACYTPVNVVRSAILAGYTRAQAWSAR